MECALANGVILVGRFESVVEGLRNDVVVISIGFIVVPVSFGEICNAIISKGAGRVRASWHETD